MISKVMTSGRVDAVYRLKQCGRVFPPLRGRAGWRNDVKIKF